MVIIMISGLNQFLGLNANAAPKIYPRQIDLSGNIFSFSMPENFSKNMPAENMVEVLDIGDLKKFDNPEYGNLIRRWWDIKKPGFFGKELGTVMMDISVQRVPDNHRKLVHDNPYDITDRLDFLLLINDKLHQRYDELYENQRKIDQHSNDYSIDFCYLIGSKLKSHYRDYQFNNQKWIGYTTTAPDAQLIVGLVTPITKNNFIELVFTFSPNTNVVPNEFLREANKTTQLIENSLKIDFFKNNTIQNLIEEEWLSATNNEVLAAHKDRILVPLFGPDIYQRLEQEKKDALKLQKELESPLE